MEDLFYLFFVALLIAAVVALVIAGFVVAATIAAICVFGAAIHAFFVTMSRSIVHRGGVRAASGPDEPSFRAYYRRQVWTDLGLAVRAAWTRAIEETSQIRALVPAGWSPSVRVVVGVAVAVYAFVGLGIGALLAVAIGAIPALAIAIFAAGAWA